MAGGSDQVMTQDQNQDQQAQPRKRYRSRVSYQINIQERITRLTRPSKSREHVPLGYHPSYDLVVIHHLSLLEQLRIAVSGSARADGASGPSFSSRAPIRLDALDVLERIEREARAWVKSLGGKCRATVEGNLWFLSGATADLDVVELLDDLDSAARSWEVGAAVTSGWDAPAWRPHVPCMACDQSDTLRVRAEQTPSGWSPRAYCVECGAAWDVSNIGVLGNHIQIVLDQRAEQLAEQLRQAGASPSPDQWKDLLPSVPAVLRGVSPEVGS